MITRLLVLRTVGADMTSRGFRWPVSGSVRCTDWDPDPQRDCGGGLHGLPWGYGNGDLLSWNPDSRWLVVSVDLGAGCVGSADKCRFRRGVVLHCGDRLSATRYLQSEGATGPVVGAIVTVGDGGTATVGEYGTATAGVGGTIAIRYWDGSRHRIVSADVGKNGIEPNVAYRVDGGNLVRA